MAHNQTMDVSPLNITIGGLTLGTLDSSLSGYPIFNHTGMDFPITRVEMEDFGSTNGAGLGIYLYGKRVMSIEGEIWGVNPADFELKRRALQQALDIMLGLQEITVVTRGGLTVVSNVILNAKLDLAYTKNDIFRCPFRIEMASPDPYLKSPTDITSTILVSTGGGFAIPFAIPLSVANGGSGALQVIVNEGTARALPNVKIYGGIQNPSIRNETTQETLSLTYTPTAGNYVEFDFVNRTARLNGVTDIVENVSGDWWYLQPGNNTIKFFGASPTAEAQAVVKHRHQYLGI